MKKDLTSFSPQTTFRFKNETMKFFYLLRGESKKDFLKLE